YCRLVNSLCQRYKVCGLFYAIALITQMIEMGADKVKRLVFFFYQYPGYRPSFSTQFGIYLQMITFPFLNRQFRKYGISIFTAIKVLRFGKEEIHAGQFAQIIGKASMYGHTGSVFFNIMKSHEIRVGSLDAVLYFMQIRNIAGTCTTDIICQNGYGERCFFLWLWYWLSTVFISQKK